MNNYIFENRRTALYSQPLIWLLIYGAFNSISAQETVSFPARSSDLINGRYWTVAEFSEGCCKMDFQVKRYVNNHWVGADDQGASLDYGVPLYAPANGEVCSCWRNFPDENSDQIFKGGNHIKIKTAENNIISLNHLKPGSIPQGLCPNNNDNTVYPSNMTHQGKWYVAGYIEPQNRPKIKEGEFIGQVGDSGNSAGAHLHMSIAPVIGIDQFGREDVGNERPLRFRQAWGHSYTNNQNVRPEGWYRYLGGEFTNNDFKIIHPSPFLRRATMDAGSIRKVDVAFISGDRFVTALIDSDHKLKLISWDLIGLDNIIRREDIEAGIVSDVQVIKGQSDDVVVAVKALNGELKLIWYGITPSGAFSRRAEISAGLIMELDLLRTGNLPRLDFSFVTVVRDATSNLKIIAWDLRSTLSGSSIIRRGDVQAGRVSSLSSSPAENFRGLYTAVRDNDNNLKIIPWRISSNGMSITRGQDISAGEINGKISIVAINQGACIAVGDSENNTRIITVESTSDGDIIERKSTLVLNEVREVNLLSTPNAGSNISAIVKDSEGDLRLIGLLINRDGSNLRRIGSSVAGNASQISADGVSRSYPGNSPRDMILTALSDSNGNLKLIAWDTNLNNPE